MLVLISHGVFPVQSTSELIPICEAGSASPKQRRFPVVKTHAVPLLGANSMETPYSLGTDDHWPDQGLNRILATLDRFDTGGLCEVECLEMLIYLSARRKDARKLAEETIEAYGSLAKVFSRTGKELRETLGFDNATTSLLAVAKTSMKYILEPGIIDRQELSSYAALMDYLALDLREADQEILRVIYLDTNCKIIKDEEMSRGTVNATPIYPKEIAKRALAYCASSVILAHNHLSDDPTPSRGDVDATIKTQEALGNFDIVLHDHVIIARRRCLSMQQQGLLIGHLCGLANPLSHLVD